MLAINYYNDLQNKKYCRFVLENNTIINIIEKIITVFNNCIRNLKDLEKYWKCKNSQMLMHTLNDDNSYFLIVERNFVYYSL